MYWADIMVGEIKDRFKAEIEAGTPLLIHDEKTLSGRVHVGSLRGIAIHGIIAQLLKQEGINCTFKFELNDFDPMDGLPVGEIVYEKHMGKPLYAVPDEKGDSVNFPTQFGDELQGVTEKLGFPIEYYTLRPLYEGGDFNEVIAEALDHADLIRTIYKEVSGSEKPADWFPLNVVCEECGKIGTTQVTAWDGKEVTYKCVKDQVTWAQGCEHEGKMSPFDGSAKLPWKVEWPAKWKVLGVHIEGAGKDHSAAGGSREIGARIVKEVFGYENPYDIPYEFINIGGKKMSASKGLGASAKAVNDLLPPHIMRLLMLRKKPNQPIDFNPEGTTIPALFDEFDRMSDHYFGRHAEPDEDLKRKFVIAYADMEPTDLWTMRFSVLSFVLQMPHLDVVEEAEKLKGEALTKEEKEKLEERSYYVKKWLDEYAPDDAKFEIQESAPKDLDLDDTQKAAFAKLTEVLGEVKWEGAPIHEAIHKVKEEASLEPKQMFQPLYKLFLGRTSGPQVGWFLSTLEQAKVIDFLASVSK